VVRAGTTSLYWWGDGVGAGNANCDGCGSQWDDKRTAPVGSFRPNAFGIYDTIGNVWEWVEDC
jgi:formylglycine-generating enzyme required for sulfatase activity